MKYKWKQLYIEHKVLRTIRTCKTKRQLDNCENYIELASAYLKRDQMDDVMERYFDKRKEMEKQ